SLARVRAVLERATDCIATRSTDDKLATMLAERELDWTRLDCDVLHLSDPDRAHELLLCARREGEPLLPTLARRAGARITSRSFFLQDIPERVRGRLVGARVGDLVGPIAEGRGTSVLLVRQRRGPTLADPGLVSMAREILERKILDEAWIGSLRRGGAHG
ncbi:MAG: hypothetical protein KUG77_20335, partial [Nannocystaceae bacterium]|nr:hypothetical protein [Nannocystaceae bacterium]